MQNSRNHPIDCGLATTDPFSRQFAKQTIANRSANIVYNQINRITDPVNPINIQYGDLNVLRYDQGQAVTDFEISIDPNAGGSPFLKSIQSSNESILANTLENPLLFTFVNNGECVVNTELQNGEKYAKLLKTETLTSFQYDVFQSFAEGSLIKAINDSTVPFLDDSTSPLGHYAYYSTYNSTTNTFVKNTSCWLADLDLSGTCVLTAGGNTRMCSMITPYFAVGVRHGEFHPRAGESVVFCAPQNESVTRTVESVHYIPQPLEGSPFYDFSLIKFTQPVPESIKKYKLFPPNSINYFPINYTFNRFFLVTEPPTQEYYSMKYCPIVGISHYRWDSEYQGQRNNRFIYLCETTRADFQNIIGINFDLHQGYPNYNSGYAPSNDAYSPAFRGGDSGGPVFAILNGDLILLGAHLSGTSILHFGSIKNQIQNLIDSIGPIGQSIQTVDVSGFTDFSS